VGQYSDEELDSWTSITESKAVLPDAEELKDIKNKLDHLVK